MELLSKVVHLFTTVFTRIRAVGSYIQLLWLVIDRLWVPSVFYILIGWGAFWVVGEVVVARNNFKTFLSDRAPSHQQNIVEGSITIIKEITFQ